MREKITTISVAIIAIILVLWTGYFVTERYLELSSTVGQITTFINNQIQAAQKAAPATK